MSETWNDDERARLKAFAESGDPDDLLTDDNSIHAGWQPNGETPLSLCKEWRERVRNSEENAADVSREVSWSASTVRNHVYGHCDHPEHAVGEAAESAGPGGVGW